MKTSIGILGSAAALWLLFAAACDGGDEVRPPTGGAGGSGATTGAGAGGADACFEGDPATEEQLLNACTGIGCEAFDNAARLPRLGPDGSLPPLP